jgi:D-glycero-D-manno-heptose 1,7-bisphosphate phosphatase
LFLTQNLKKTKQNGSQQINKKKAIFLDRDGILNESIVVNGKPLSPRKISEVLIPNGIDKKLLEFKKKDYLLVCVTNQPDVARGTIDMNDVDKLNNFLKIRLSIDYFYVCPHDDNDYCGCRKPKSGNLIQAAKDHNIDLTKSFIVGDRWKDIAAGKAVNCKTAFVDYNYNEKKPYKYDFYALTPSHVMEKILNFING